ncbi:hypothetical protein SKAU_G00387490 [Synaphobranchus kaupii]|uniref:Uncharacterized protein n=1 Tax=Synaphobranchus kaupii TaxID=118154 RepID=A0A9Q1EAY8_SYNKA|nr:hypothetical protein SKAU_G00387490 [Synaphobranchus kaupii]
MLLDQLFHQLQPKVLVRHAFLYGQFSMDSVGIEDCSVEQVKKQLLVPLVLFLAQSTKLVIMVRPVHCSHLLVVVEDACRFNLWLPGEVVQPSRLSHGRGVNSCEEVHIPLVLPLYRQLSAILPEGDLPLSSFSLGTLASPSYSADCPTRPSPWWSSKCWNSIGLLYQFFHIQYAVLALRPQLAGLDS